MIDIASRNASTPILAFLFVVGCASAPGSESDAGPETEPANGEDGEDGPEIADGPDAAAAPDVAPVSDAGADGNSTNEPEEAPVSAAGADGDPTSEPDEEPEADAGADGDSTNEPDEAAEPDDDADPGSDAEATSATDLAPEPDPTTDPDTSPEPDTVTDPDTSPVPDAVPDTSGFEPEAGAEPDAGTEPDVWVDSICDAIAYGCGLGFDVYEETVSAYLALPEPTTGVCTTPWSILKAPKIDSPCALDADVAPDPVANNFFFLMDIVIAEVKASLESALSRIFPDDDELQFWAEQGAIACAEACRTQYRAFLWEELDLAASAGLEGLAFETGRQAGATHFAETLNEWFAASELPATYPDVEPGSAPVASWNGLVSAAQSKAIATVDAIPPLCEGTVPATTAEALLLDMLKSDYAKGAKSGIYAEIGLANVTFLELWTCPAAPWP